MSKMNHNYDIDLLVDGDRLDRNTENGSVCRDHSIGQPCMALLESLKLKQADPAVDRRATVPPLRPAGAAVDARAKEKRGKMVRQALLVVVAAALAYGAYRLIDALFGDGYFQETNDAYVRADTVAVSSKLGGYIRDVMVRDNQAVTRGTVLARIDPADFANRLADADSQIAVASANRDALNAAVNVARTGILQAEAALTASRRDLSFLTAQANMYRSLASTGAEPQQAYDKILADRDKARADIAGRQASLVAAHSQLAAAQAQLQQGTAQLRSAQVRKQASQNDLAAAQVIAPVSGRVVISGLRRGQFVQPGQRLLSVVPTRDIYVEANFKETQIGLMRPGQPVAIAIDALPGIHFRGYVESLAPGTGSNFSMIPPQNATGNFVKIVQRVPVRVYIVAGPESRKVLVPGLSAHVEIDTRSARAAQQAIEREQAEATPQ